MNEEEVVMEDFGTLVQQYEQVQKALHARRETLLEEVKQIDLVLGGGTKTDRVRKATHPPMIGLVDLLRRIIPQQPPGPLDFYRLADALVAQRPNWDRQVVRNRLAASIAHLVRTGEVIRSGDHIFATSYAPVGLPNGAAS